jgi:hypothetical protein
MTNEIAALGVGRKPAPRLVLIAVDVGVSRTWRKPEYKVGPHPDSVLRAYRGIRADEVRPHVIDVKSNCIGWRQVVLNSGSNRPGKA